jgi:hypothetical protein
MNHIGKDFGVKKLGMQNGYMSIMKSIKMIMMNFLKNMKFLSMNELKIW